MHHRCILVDGVVVIHALQEKRKLFPAAININQLCSKYNLRGVSFEVVINIEDALEAS